jgi:hypothetical protein
LITCIYYPAVTLNQFAAFTKICPTVHAVYRHAISIVSNRGVYSSIIPPPPPGVGEKNQRVLGLGKKIKEE